MSFSSEAKAALLRSEPKKKCCALAECYGILLFCTAFSAQEIRIITGGAELAEALPRLFRRAFGVTFDQLRRAVTLVCGGCRVVACDVNELSPPYDPSGVSNAVAAKIVREMLLAFPNG